MNRFIFLLILGGLFVSCGNNIRQDERRISVSILPLKYWVDEISGGDFEVTVVIPPGASPETYEPIPSQMKEVARSIGYIQTGLLDSEFHIARGIGTNAPVLPVLNLSEGLDLLEGTCGHDHSGGSVYHHGTDPHIWLSPVRSLILVDKITDFLVAFLPDSASKYRANQEMIKGRINDLNENIISSLEALEHRIVLLFHPFLTYYCADYGLTQLAIEQDGKEPSVNHLMGIVLKIKNRGLYSVFYQEQLHQNTVAVLTAETGIRAIALDPLAYDWMENLLKITYEIARSERDE